MAEFNYRQYVADMAQRTGPMFENNDADQLSNSGLDQLDLPVSINEEDLKEYEVIYVVQNGKCYRITDEGYKDEVSMDKCRMYAEAKEKEEEGYMGTQYDSSEDMAVDMVKKGITEKDETEEALSMDATQRMDGLVPQTALKAVMSGTQAIIRDLKQEGFEDDEIFDFIVSKIKTLGESKQPTEEALGGKNPEGDALVLRFLQGISKKFGYPVAKAAIFVKDTIKSLGY